MNKSLHFETCKDFPPGGREFGLTSLSFLAILKVGYFVDRCVVPLRGCGAATVTLDRAERAMVMAMAKNRVHLKIGGSAYTVLTDDAPGMWRSWPRSWTRKCAALSMRTPVFP